MPRRPQPILETIAPGQHSSITLTPSDYKISVKPTGIIFTANSATTITIGHPPPPGKNTDYALSPGEEFTLHLADNGQLTILAYQEFTLPDKPVRPRRR